MNISIGLIIRDEWILGSTFFRHSYLKIATKALKENEEGVIATILDKSLL
jgi:hypothetical protein